MSETKPKSEPTPPTDYVKQVVIELLEPITVAGVITSRLTCRRLKLQDRLAVDDIEGSEAIKEVALFAYMVGLAPSDLSQLDLSDYMQLQTAYQTFMKARPSKT